jgi:hypothetical protein
MGRRRPCFSHARRRYWLRPEPAPKASSPIPKLHLVILLSRQSLAGVLCLVPLGCLGFSGSAFHVRLQLTRCTQPARKGRREGYKHPQWGGGLSMVGGGSFFPPDFPPNSSLQGGIGWGEIVSRNCRSPCFPEPNNIGPYRME